MKTCFCRFEADGAVRWGIVKGAAVHEILPDPFAAFELTGFAWGLKNIRLLAPVQPTKIVAVGVNYSDHAKEFGKAPPPEPLIFLKPPSAVIGPNDPIRLPRASRQVDFEGEIAVVIGRRAKNVSRASAEKYILGYTLMNDVTARDLQRSDGQWTRAKGFDTFCAIGPWIDTAFEPAGAAVSCRVNGAVRQHASTRDMVFSVESLVAFISSVMTLEPGDLIFTGTPAGISPLRPGDTVEVCIDGLGTLRNPVRAADR